MMHQTMQPPTAVADFLADCPEAMHLTKRFGRNLEGLTKPEKSVLIVALATEIGIWSSGNPALPTLPQILEVMFEGRAFDLADLEISNLRYIASTIEEIDEHEQIRFITCLSAQMVANQYRELAPADFR